MKRFLNLNAYGMIFLVAIGLFLFVFPAALYAGSQLLSPVNPAAPVLLNAARLSAMIGACLLAAFALLLIIEQVQDKVIFRQYLKSRNKKLLLANGRYECQFCGCRSVREIDVVCPVCGKSLE